MEGNTILQKMYMGRTRHISGPPVDNPDTVHVTLRNYIFVEVTPSCQGLLYFLTIRSVVHTQKISVFSFGDGSCLFVCSLFNDAFSVSQTI
jgi:hypothetical protein